MFFLFFRTVVGTLDVADMMAVIAIGVTQYKGWSFTLTGTLNVTRRGSINGANILSIDLFGRDTKSAGSCAHLTGSSLDVVRIFIVMIVLTDIDNGKFPQ